MAETQPLFPPKITIIFPPGDQLASLLLSKENDSKLEDLVGRLCALRAIDFDLKKLAALNDVGEEIDLSKTVSESGLLFIELVDRKDIKKEKKRKVKESGTSRGLPNGIKLKVGESLNLPLAEQLFDDEKKSLQEFKAKHPELTSKFSDEFVMGCLFARKFDLDRTLELLENSLKWRKDNNMMNLPKFEDFDHHVFNTETHIVGARDKYGRCIKYIYPANITPHSGPFTIENMKKYYTWFNYVGIFAEGIDALRNGVHGVVEFGGYSWKNMDIDYQRQMSALWSNTFPLLVRRGDLMNPPVIVNAMLKVMGTFVKAKVMDRMHVCKKEKSLLKSIEKNNLWSKRGGDVDWSPEKYESLLAEWAEKNEQRLTAAGRV